MTAVFDWNNLYLSISRDNGGSIKTVQIPGCRMSHEVPKLPGNAPDLPGAAFRAPVCERGHQRPADADGICPQRQCLVILICAKVIDTKKEIL